jgi:hypothetical protein
MITLASAPAIRKGQPASKQIGYVYKDTGEGLPELAILSDWKPKLELFRDIASFHVEDAARRRAFRVLALLADLDAPQRAQVLKVAMRLSTA